MTVDLRLLHYSPIPDFRRAGRVQDESPDTDLLRQIEDEISAAARHSAGRRYQEAIAAYRRATGLIWTEIDPAAHPRAGTAPPPSRARFRPLLEASLGWLSLLPVPAPVSPVAPSTPDGVGHLAADRVGLVARAVSSPASLAAASRARLAGILSKQGSIDAGRAAGAGAAGLDPAVAHALLTAVTGPARSVPATAPPPPPAPPPAPLPGRTPAAAPSSRLAPVRLLRRLVPWSARRETPVASDVASGPERAAAPAQMPPIVTAPPIGPAALTAPAAAPSATPGTILPASLTQQRRRGVSVAEQGTGQVRVASFDFTVGSIPDPAAIERHVYASRVRNAAMPDILAQPLLATDFVLALSHFYHYVIPVGMADCYTALGDWTNAELGYLLAASYDYLNEAVEAPQLWAKLATLYLRWADSLYRADDPAGALPIYERIVTQGGAVPNSRLYTTPGIGAGAELARPIIDTLPKPGTEPGELGGAPEPVIAAPVLGAYLKIGQIKAGLDFHGHWASTVPIWTFDYLQRVATQFCQLAVSAEQSVITYWDRADQGALTRQQLVQHAVDSAAEVDVATRQWLIAKAEEHAYSKAFDLAKMRAADAQANHDDYQSLHGDAILYQAFAGAVAYDHGEVMNWLDTYADQTLQGSRPAAPDKGMKGPGLQLVANRLSMQYELASMQRTADELKLAIDQAATEFVAMSGRRFAADLQRNIAELHRDEAKALLQTFNEATFTPEVWQAIGDRLFALYRRHLDMALRAAKLMQSAYNFENDTTMKVIRADYTGDEIRGLLGADTLAADIASFTDAQLSSARGKTQLITHTVSLATRHSYAFETQFRRAGRMAFETTADDFDLAYPGTYGGRIRRVDVTLQGLVPVGGFAGTLTCGGLSFYRLPMDAWKDQNSDQMRRRIQPAETLVLSDLDRRTEPADADDRQAGIFAGAGVIGSWVLDIPPEVNDIDYRLITDVLITFTYQARYDPALAGAVREILHNQPGAHVTQLALPLRWLYPDTFFNLVNNHTATLHIAATDLPLNHTNATLTRLGLLIIPRQHAADGLTIEVTAPGAASLAAVVTDESGLASSTSAGGALSTQLGRPVVGDWTLAVPADGGAGWMTDGAIDLTDLANVTLLLEYRYTPRTAA